MPAKRAPIVACGVIGHPVSHSLSPDIFGFLAKRLKVKLVYQRLDVRPEELSEFVRTACETHLFRGWNVTIPHKSALAGLCSELSAEAAAVGAVNVAEFLGQGIRGHNTDVIGIRETLREKRFQARGKLAVIFGAGGAAAAVGYVLGEQRAKRVVIQNRTVAKAEGIVRCLRELFPKTRFEVAPRASGEFDLYVNATPLGMQGFSYERLLPARVKRGALAFDLVYRPEKTPFLADARHGGLRPVGGLDMLIWQAIGTWEIWFGPVTGKPRLKSALTTHLRKVLARSQG